MTHIRQQEEPPSQCYADLSPDELAEACLNRHQSSHELPDSENIVGFPQRNVQNHSHLNNINDHQFRRSQHPEWQKSQKYLQEQRSFGQIDRTTKDSTLIISQRNDLGNQLLQQSSELIGPRFDVHTSQRTNTCDVNNGSKPNQRIEHTNDLSQRSAVVLNPSSRSQSNFGT